MDFSILFDFATTATDPEMFAYLQNVQIALSRPWKYIAGEYSVL